MTRRYIPTIVRNQERWFSTFRIYHKVSFSSFILDENNNSNLVFFQGGSTTFKRHELVAYHFNQRPKIGSIGCNVKTTKSKATIEARLPFMSVDRMGIYELFRMGQDTQRAGLGCLINKHEKRPSVFL